VWSVTKDAGFRERFVRKLEAIPDVRRILLPGCGSETILQRDLVGHLPQLEEIICSDFEPAIRIAETSGGSPKVSFHVVDSTRVHESWPLRFDVVSPINSVVSESDGENRAMLAAFSESLRPGGWLLGTFPCIYSIHELYRFASQEKREQLSAQESLELDTRTYTWLPRDPELPARVPQLMYSVNDLRILLDEAGFDLDTLEMTIDVQAGASSREGVKQWHGIDDPRVCRWDFMVKVRKKVGG
jgi:hypothetical protein